MRQTPGSESERGNFKYFAFISYSHRDKKWGDWLHQSLETYRVPKRLVGSTAREGQVPARLFPIFRDREELPTSADLGGNIRSALEESRFLVVICSPNSARSLWVNEEILHFKKLGRESRVMPLIVAGEPNASDSFGGPDARRECFAPALRFALGADGALSDKRSEPIAADARASGDGPANAKLKLLAGILGVDFDLLKQRERIRKRRRMAATAAAALCLCAMGAGIWKYQDWKGRRAIAMQKQAHEAQLRANEALLSEEQGRAALLKGDTLAAAKDLLSAYKVLHEEPGLRLMLGFAMRRLEGLTHVLQGRTGSIRQMNFAFTGRYLSTIAEDGVARIWDVESGRALQVFGRDGDKSNQIRRVQLSSDGGRVLFENSSDCFIQELGTGGETDRLGFACELVKTRFSFIHAGPTVCHWLENGGGDFRRKFLNGIDRMGCVQRSADFNRIDRR
jgi:hypothetical protein